MKKSVHLPGIPVKVAIGLLMCLGLYLASIHNYLLFHIIAEVFAIVVAFGMFMVVWNSRRFFDNNSLLFVGIAYVFVASLDFVHTISYYGMGVFVGGDEANHATQLWIAARYLESLSLLIAPLCLRRRLNIPLVMAGYVLVVTLALVSIFASVFPDCFLPGTGLTPFKKISEYVISLILIGAVTVFARNRAEFDKKVFTYIILSITATILSELFFTFYVSVYGVSNFVGHALKILSFYLIYKAVIETSLARPYDLLFRNLKRSEDSLTRQREWLRVTLSSIGEGIIATDNEGKVVFMNPVAVTVTGWQRRDAIGQPVTAILKILDNRREGGADFINEVLEERHPAGHTDCPVLCLSDGKEIPVEYSVAPITTGEGTVSGIVIVFHDVTEQRRDQDRLRKVNEELEIKVRERTAELKRQADLLNLTHDAIFVRDHRGRITFWNQGATKIYGWTEEEALGCVSSDLLATSYPRPLMEIESQVFSQGRWDGEVIHTRKDGGQITVASRWALAADEPIQILEINSDITEQKNAEHQLRQAQKQEALGVLVGGIAHDFNNILAAIVGFTEMILDRVLPGSREHRHASRVMQAGIRGRDLVRQMLTFSRSSSDERKPVDLGRIVGETVNLLRASIPATIEIRVDRRCKEGSVVLGDPVQMEQVLMNLSTNASYAMRETGGLLSIGLSDHEVPLVEATRYSVEPGPYVKLVVSDTGTGMSSAVIERVFDPFFTTKPAGEGSGLGLSVVLGIVKQSKGFITVESGKDKGSTFAVHLPRITKQPETGGDPGAKAIPTGHERILFVDDEEVLVEAGRQLLDGLGYEVVSATSAGEALETFAGDPTGFDLVITDQTMPQMTGTELAERILLIRPDLPVILCTGYSYLVNEESARAAGVRAFVMKPLTKREMAGTVREVLDRQR